MHGLINRAVQCFVVDTYGAETWMEVTRDAELDFVEFEAMLIYAEFVTSDVLDSAAKILERPRHDIMEDIGTYLVSHPHVGAIRRLLRFGGVDFPDFIHSLEDLPDRARLAVPDLNLPAIQLRENGDDCYTLTFDTFIDGFGHVLIGILRAMADDYGALALLEHHQCSTGKETLTIRLVKTDYAAGRSFELGAREA